MKKMNRVIWIILDSVGIGELPDAKDYGDVGAATLQHIYEQRGLDVPCLKSLGLGDIEGVNIDISNNDVLDKDATHFDSLCIKKTSTPVGVYGKAAAVSYGKDTTIGHWEMIGVVSKKPFPTYPNGFPEEIVDRFIKETGVDGILGNCTASGTAIIDELGDEHIKTGKPIIYTSADSVFQIACHEDVYSVEKLYEMCSVARKILVGEHAVARVIARPFTGKEGIYKRTSNRRDFSLEPDSDNLLKNISDSGLEVAAVGKIEDIFAGSGITSAVHTVDNKDGIDKTLEYMKNVKAGLIFTNLVDFDSKWGHRRDVEGYGRGLEDFDSRLNNIIEAMNEEDILFINADHGCDPTFTGTDHTREYVPVLVYSKQMKQGINLGTLSSFADIGQTISEILNVKPLKYGKSFISKISESMLDKCFVKSSNANESISRTVKIDNNINSQNHMNVYDIITKKKRGNKLSREEIEHMVLGYTNGDVPDYQMSALLMAICINGMDEVETFALTEIMRDSGDVLNLSDINGIKVDKHSTGGVGDKVSLILSPMVAALGVPVAKMSGRGLGHTGGTIDKLESINGFTTDMTREQFVNNVNNFGMAIAGQTANLAPADKKIYALRDVTATVDCIPLIASSIMSKKLASGADAIVLDVKCGNGAFMKNEESAKELAKTMINIGEKAGKTMSAVITDMNQPLGTHIGNSLEVAEAIEALKGNGSHDIMEVVFELGTCMIIDSGLESDRNTARCLLEETITSGKAIEKFKDFVCAQGGDVSIIENIQELYKTSICEEIFADCQGYISSIDTESIGRAVQILGGGRETKDSIIDPLVGIIINKKIGDVVSINDSIFKIYANDENKFLDAVRLLKNSYHIEIDRKNVEVPPIIKEVM